MTCDRIQSLIEEYFDRELAPADHDLVEAHLAGCEACTAELESLEREQLLYARYDRGFEPAPEMWQAVLARIEPEGPLRPEESRLGAWLARLGELFAPGRLVPLAAAACAVVVIGAFAVKVVLEKQAEPGPTANIVESPPPPAPGTQGRQNVEPPTPPEPPRVTEEPSKPAPRRVKQIKQKDGQGEVASQLPVTVVDAERKYLRAIAVLTKDVERGGGPRDPKLEKPLDDIDRNIVTARQAAEKNPHDPDAVLNMFSAYDRKVEVLQTLAQYQVARNR